MNIIPKFVYQFGHPQGFYRLAIKLQPWLFALSTLSLFTGLVWGLFWAPADYQQGDAFRIIYVHVPAAFCSLSIFSFIGCASVIYLIWQPKVMDILAASSARIGATYTAIALITGAIWGKPMWGTWWVWDARLTSELILFLLYCGYIGLRQAIPDTRVCAKAAAIFGIIALIDVPIVHFSVNWWQTLHQGPTVAKFGAPAIDAAMLYPLLLSIIGFYLFYAWSVCSATTAEILWRERETKWVRRELNYGG